MTIGRTDAVLGLRANVLATSVLVMSVLAVSLLAQGSAAAQTYPVRPITIIVPFAAGGPTDVLARVVGEHIRADLGQPVLIENVTGAGGFIGGGRVAAAGAGGFPRRARPFRPHRAHRARHSLEIRDLVHPPPACT